MAAEADELARTSFGPTMLRAIGRCYVSQVAGGTRHAHNACLRPAFSVMLCEVIMHCKALFADAHDAPDHAVSGVLVGTEGADIAACTDQAEIHLGNFFEGSIAAMKSKGHNLKSQMHAAGLALKVPLRFLVPLRLSWPLLRYHGAACAWVPQWVHTAGMFSCGLGTQQDQLGWGICWSSMRESAGLQVYHLQQQVEAAGGRLPQRVAVTARESG